MGNSKGMVIRLEIETIDAAKILITLLSRKGNMKSNYKIKSLNENQLKSNIEISNPIIINGFETKYFITSFGRVYKVLDDCIIRYIVPSIDKNGYSGWADICVNFESYFDEINKINAFTAKEIIKEKKDFFAKTKISKHAQSDSKIELPGDYIFFPMQINSDSVTDHENISAIDVLDYIADLALKTNRYVIIKRHPL